LDIPRSLDSSSSLACAINRLELSPSITAVRTPRRGEQEPGRGHEHYDVGGHRHPGMTRSACGAERGNLSTSRSRNQIADQVPLLPDDIGLHSFVDGAHSLPMAQVTATEPLPRSMNGIQSVGWLL
jgi:hypothetical protein